MEVWQILLNSGVSGSVLALVFLLYTFIKNKKNSSHQNKASNNNNITLNSNKDDSIHLLKEELKETKKLLNEVSKSLNELSWDVKKLSIALNYYVDNNGVSEEVKKHFKNILEERRE